MIIDSTNSIVNYSRYHTRDIHATIRLLSTEQKQRLVEEITLRKGIRDLLGKEYDYNDCACIEKLLQKTQS